VCINPATRPQPYDVLDMVRAIVVDGEDRLSSGGPDVAKPEVVDAGYDATPVGPYLSLMDGLAALQTDLGRVGCPVLIMTSPADYVVDPESSDHLAAAVAGPVERRTLERSYHVATVDHDGPLVSEAAVAFGRKVTAARRR
jgi:carboxylesterase